MSARTVRYVLVDRNWSATSTSLFLTEHVRLASYLSEQCGTHAKMTFSQCQQVKHVTGYFVQNVADDELKTTALYIL